MDGRYLVAFDIDAIREYVFGAVRPVDVLGASRVVEDFAGRVEALVAERGGDVVYAAGGGGLVIVDGDESVAEEQAAAIAQAFAEETAGAGTCTTVVVPLRPDFPEARTQAHRRMARRKAERGLDAACEELVPPGTLPRDLCQGCGVEPADRTDHPGGAETERIGPRCHRRRERGRDRRQDVVANTLELLALFDDPDRRQLLAAVYLDADGAGDQLVSQPDRDSLAGFAETLRRATEAALREALEGTGLANRVLTPVVGGDDLVVFCEAARVPALVAMVWEVLSRELTGPAAGMRFSAGVAIGEHHLPLKLFFDRAEAVLRQAKDTGHTTSQAHVALGTVGGRRPDGSADQVFGAPVPRSLFWPDAGDGGPSLRRLVAALDAVPAAQRAGMTDDLAQPSRAAADLDLAYRAARPAGKPVGDAVAAATALAERLPDGDPHRVLLGGLWLTGVVAGPGDMA